MFWMGRFGCASIIGFAPLAPRCALRQPAPSVRLGAALGGQASALESCPCVLPSLRSGATRRYVCLSMHPYGSRAQANVSARSYGLPMCGLPTQRGGLPCPPRTPPAAYGLAAFPRARSASSRLPAAECAACIGGGVVSFVGRGRSCRHGLRVRPGCARRALKGHARRRSQKRCAPVPAAPAHSFFIGYALGYALLHALPLVLPPRLVCSRCRATSPLSGCVCLALPRAKLLTCPCVSRLSARAPAVGALARGPPPRARVARGAPAPSRSPPPHTRRPRQGRRGFGRAVSAFGGGFYRLRAAGFHIGLAALSRRVCSGLSCGVLALFVPLGA